MITLPETSSKRPENRRGPESIFRSELLVSGRVYTPNISKPWLTLRKNDGRLIIAHTFIYWKNWWTSPKKNQGHCPALFQLSPPPHYLFPPQKKTPHLKKTSRVFINHPWHPLDTEAQPQSTNAASWKALPNRIHHFQSFQYSITFGLVSRRKIRRKIPPLWKKRWKPRWG